MYVVFTKNFDLADWNTLTAISLISAWKHLNFSDIMHVAFMKNFEIADWKSLVLLGSNRPPDPEKLISNFLNIMYVGSWKI